MIPRAPVLVTALILSFTQTTLAATTRIHVKTPRFEFDFTSSPAEVRYRDASYTRGISISKCNKPLVDDFLRKYRELKSKSESFRVIGSAPAIIKVRESGKFLDVLPYTEFGTYLEKFDGAFLSLVVRSELRCGK